MKKRVILIYDCDKKNNDKEWLANEIKKNNGIILNVIYSKYVLAKVWITGGLKNKLKAYKEIIRQLYVARRIVKESQEKCTVVCWSIMTGMLSVFIIPYNAKIFSLNWLSPDGRKLNTKVRKKCLRDKRFYAFADQEGTMREIVEYYDLKGYDRIDYFPDTFSDRGKFVDISYEIIRMRREKKICFTGGFNNRNWDMLYKVAKALPGINFIAIGCPESFEKNNQLCNLKCYSKVSEDEYYEAMKSAYLIYIPLNDKRAAGAINMYRASMNQQLCIITDAPSTRPYFPMAFYNQLLMSNKIEEHVKKIQNMFAMDDKEYLENVISIKKYLVEKFSAINISARLINKILKEDF